jgi:hypothetical protein
MSCPDEKKKESGLMIDTERNPFSAKRIADGILRVEFGEKSVTFFEDRIEIVSDKLTWYDGSTKADMNIGKDGIAFEYKGHSYRLNIDGAEFFKLDGNIEFTSASKKITIYPKKV